MVIDISREEQGPFWMSFEIRGAKDLLNKRSRWHPQMGFKIVVQTC